MVVPQRMEHDLIVYETLNTHSDMSVMIDKTSIKINQTEYRIDTITAHFTAQLVFISIQKL